MSSSLLHVVKGLASLAELADLEPTIAAFGHGGEPITTDVATQLRDVAAG